MRALDRYTLQFRFSEPQPRFDYMMADGAISGALAREVVEAYGDTIMAHPVGTGPYRLAEWRRSSRMVFERNPNYREHLYDEQAPAADARSARDRQVAEGPQAAADRPRRGLDRRGEPAALAELPRTAPST